MNPIILIPARMSATRLPGKPLADIHGRPMIVHVWQRAIESRAGRVVVACDDEAIAAVIRAAGGEAVLTDPNHPSGSDRIYEALRKVDADGRHDVVVNLQGDMPTLEPKLVQDVVGLMRDAAVDIGTLVAVIRDDAEKNDPAVVKAVLAENGRALYFSRALVPTGEGEHYHHIGIYAYRREALQRFVALPPSPLEKREKLEQLRALEAGMMIKAAIVATTPLGVDTPETLDKARRMLA